VTKKKIQGKDNSNVVVNSCVVTTSLITSGDVWKLPTFDTLQKRHFVKVNYLYEATFSIVDISAKKTILNGNYFFIN